MHSPRLFTLAAAAMAAVALAACGPVPGQPGPQPISGNVALRTHGHGIGHAALAPETAMAENPQPGTAEVAAGPNQDSLAAANRARADSLEQARLAAERSARASAAETARLSAALGQELAGPIHFDFDQAQIPPQDRAALDRKAAILTANPNVHLRIAGYCDERGSDEYNLALGNRRAAGVKQYLIERGIDAGRLDAVSFGSASPLDPAQNEAAWAQNRRAGFEVVNGGDALTAPVALR